MIFEIKKIINKYSIYLTDNRFTPYYLVVKTLILWRIFALLGSRNQHNLSEPLVVSLTSYKERFSTLSLTLRCLLSQSIRPDKTILWISFKDKKHLPNNIKKFERMGLTIKYCEDTLSYKKIIPALYSEKNSYIVTADDDVYYWKTWLEELISCKGGNNVVAHRVRTVSFDSNKNILHYNLWKINKTNLKSNRHFFTGCGGVLYPPGALPNETINNNFMELCPHADDIWLNWMIRLNGLSIRNTPVRKKLYSWPASQKKSLYNSNVKENKNDEQINNIMKVYGNVFK